MATFDPNTSLSYYTYAMEVYRGGRVTGSLCTSSNPDWAFRSGTYLKSLRRWITSSHEYWDELESNIRHPGNFINAPTMKAIDAGADEEKLKALIVLCFS